MKNTKSNKLILSIISVLAVAAITVSSFAVNIIHADPIEPSESSESESSDGSADTSGNESDTVDSSDTSSSAETEPSSETDNDPVPTNKYLLTIEYVDENGSTVAPTYYYEYESGESYCVTSPSVSGYTPETIIVSGVMSDAASVYTVRYKKRSSDTTSTSSGTSTEPKEVGEWTVSGGRIRYTVNGAAATGTKTIDGKAYKFNDSGYLEGSGFVTVNGATYYLTDGAVSVGYEIINGSVYYFNNNGTMATGTNYEGYTFDINGRLTTNDDLIISVNGKSYLFSSQSLYKGYYLYNGSIVYFGDDYAMVTNGEVDGYYFGSDGALSYGIDASELSVYVPNVVYTGEELTPAVSVTFKGLTLSENIHYTLSYKNNKDKGTAEVTVTGLGCINGSTTASFSILSESSVTLRIEYRNKIGIQMMPAHEELVEPGSKYSVKSPEIDGYVPDREVVEGTAGDEDIKVVVKYTEESQVGKDTTDTTDDEDDTTSTTTYNYKLLAIVCIPATVIAGGLILLILNLDRIKKKSAAKKARKLYKTK